MALPFSKLTLQANSAGGGVSRGPLGMVRDILSLHKCQQHLKSQVDASLE